MISGGEMQRAYQRRGSLWASVIIFATTFLAILPFYFVVSPKRFSITPSSQPEATIGHSTGQLVVGVVEPVGIPVVLAAVPALIICALYYLTQAQVSRGHIRQFVHGPHAATQITLLLFCAWNAVVALYGIATSISKHFTFAFASQTLLPFVCFFAGLILPITDAWKTRCILAVPLVSAISIVLILPEFVFYMFSEGFLFASNNIAATFYGAKIVQPVISAVGLAVLLALFNLERRPLPDWLIWLTFLVHALYLSVVWSRASLLVIVSVFGLWFFHRIWQAFRGCKYSRRQIAELAVTSCLVAVCFTVSIINISTRATPKNVLPSSTANWPAVDSLPTVVFEHGDRSRWQLLLGGIKIIEENPIIGMAFKPAPTGSILGGIKLKRPAIFPSHNQYLDIAIRGGLVSLALFLGFILYLARDLRRRWMQSSGLEKEMAAASLYLLAALAFPSCFQLYFTLTQSAILILLLFALSLRPGGALLQLNENLRR